MIYSNPSWVDHTQTCQVRPSAASESRKQSGAAPDRFTNHLGLLYIVVSNLIDPVSAPCGGMAQARAAQPAHASDVAARRQDRCDFARWNQLERLLDL